MKVVIFGATGMVGQGLLLQCLKDQEIGQVVTIVRQLTGRINPKLREIEHSDFQDFSSLRSEFAGLDACFFCLGVSALGISEPQYRQVTYDTTLAAARALLEASPELIFEYVSGQGTDSSAKGRIMWARVKGATENALLKMPFKAAYMFRPGMIIPLDGIQSKTPAYRTIYAVLRPLEPVLEKVFPTAVTNTRKLAQAMIQVAKSGYSKRVLEARDIASIVS